MGPRHPEPPSHLPPLYSFFLFSLTNETVSQYLLIKRRSLSWRVANTVDNSCSKAGEYSFTPMWRKMEKELLAGEVGRQPGACGVLEAKRRGGAMRKKAGLWQFCWWGSCWGTDSCFSHVDILVALAGVVQWGWWEKKSSWSDLKGEKEEGTYRQGA